MPGDEKIFLEAQDAVSSGDHLRARELLKGLIQTNPSQAEYWVWLSAAVDTSKERIYCLKEALQIDPMNTNARRGLIILGELPVDEKFIVPYEVQRKAAIKQFKKLGRKMTAAFKWKLAGVMASFILLLGAGIFLKNNSPSQSPVFIPPGMFLTPFPTLTPTPRATSPPVRLRSDIFNIQVSSTPLVMYLESTYTPTPLYVNTPHTRVEAYRNAINSYRRGELDRTLNYLIQVRTLEPEAFDIHYHIGEIQRQQENFEGAVVSYGESLKRNSRFAPAYLGRARAKLGLGMDRSKLFSVSPENWQKVREDIQSAVDLDPKLFEAQIEMALYEIIQGYPEKALDRVQQAAAIEPNSPLVYLTRAQANLAAGRPNIAYENAVKAGSLDVGMLPAYRVQGEALLASDMPGQAVLPLRLYLIYVPGDGQAWILMGRSFEARQNPDQALEAYQRARQVNKYLLDSYLLKAEIFIRRADLSSARLEADEAVRIGPNAPETHILRGRIMLYMKEFVPAALEFDQAGRLSRTDSQRAQVYFFRSAVQSGRGLTTQEMIDLTALINLPAGIVETEWLDYARQRLQSMYTATPTPERTPTPKPTIPDGVDFIPTPEPGL